MHPHTSKERELVEEEEAKVVVPPAYGRWMQAEESARHAEDRLHRQWVAFFFQGGPVPSSDDQRRAALLRSLAVVALTEARVEREALKRAEERG